MVHVVWVKMMQLVDFEPNRKNGINPKPPHLLMGIANPNLTRKQKRLNPTLSYWVKRGSD